MLQPPDYIYDALYTSIKPNGLKETDDLKIKSCEFSTNLESSLEYRVKIIKTAKIPILDTISPTQINITVELFFNGKDVVNVHYILMERYLMEGNRGPFVRCMGSVLWPGDLNSKLFKQSLGKLLPFLSKVSYIGPISVNVVLDKASLAITEITPTFGFDHTFALFEIMSTKLETLLWQLANSKLDEIKYKASTGIAVDICVSPFPIELLRGMKEPFIIEGLDLNNLKHFWGYDIELTEGKYRTSFKGGRIGTITARGDDKDTFTACREARRRVYRTINNLKVEGLMYRGDIGTRLEKDREQLKQWGWL